MNDDPEHVIADVIDMRRTLEERAGEGQQFKPTDESIWPAPLDLEVLAERELQPPKFIVADWLPCGYATLCAGHGGVGKSAIALHLAVCIAAGIPFFGMPAERRRVLFLSCEDRESVLHWRLARICAYLGVDLARLRGWLEILDLVGRDTVLWERDPRTNYTITPAYATLVEHMRAHGTDVLMIDGIADTFGGNENARTEVKRFINALVALIPPETGAVLLLGHIAKPTASGVVTTEGYSGSTGWHNSCRARWYLYAETEAGEGEKRGKRPRRTGDLIMELQKSNLARADRSMRFAWDSQAHLFAGRVIGAATAADHADRARVERRGILRALAGCAASTPPIIVPNATTGRRTAYHVLSAQSEFPDTLHAGNGGVSRFWSHIEALRAMGAVNDAEYRMPDRHYITQLVITAEGLRACGQ